MTLHQYIETINQRFRLGNATEQTFRGDLQQWLESLVTDISATKEPKRQYHISYNVAVCELKHIKKPN